MKRKCLVVLAVLAGAAASNAATVQFEPGEDIQLQVQEAFILAEEGTVFEFAEGVYHFDMGLSIDVDGVDRKSVV